MYSGFLIELWFLPFVIVPLVLVSLEILCVEVCVVVLVLVVLVLVLVVFVVGRGTVPVIKIYKWNHCCFKIISQMETLFIKYSLNICELPIRLQLKNPEDFEVDTSEVLNKLHFLS